MKWQKCTFWIWEIPFPSGETKIAGFCCHKAKYLCRKGNIFFRHCGITKDAKTDFTIKELINKK